ncbi:hypothetical protein KKD52_11830 [Myxococcota bacterium]|nr:hypothetical protein [Myxococcota bacterium]MBU1412341.1 hypothetical protein [Myxococcota bacterium]MBU1511044.1 hypothetical protein [Myxococcota bacterium]
MKVVLIAMVCMFSGLLIGCQNSAKVLVECKVDGEKGFLCEVKHTEGKAKAKACWDAVVTCANATKVTGSGCHEVAPGARAQHLIPFEEIKNKDKCDKAVSFDVTNVKVTIVK